MRNLVHRFVPDVLSNPPTQQEYSRSAIEPATKFGRVVSFISVHECKRQVEPRSLGDTEENRVRVGANGRVVVRLAA